MPHHDWKTQKLICHAVLTGRAEEAFAAHGVALHDQAIYHRMADDALAGVIRKRSAARRYFTARIRNPLLLVVAAAAFVSAVCLIVAWELSETVNLADPGTYPVLGSLAAFAAIGVAAMGWAVSGWVTHRTGRSKLTMDVVAARYAQPAFGDALAAFTKVLLNRRIDGELVGALERSTDEDERAAVQGLRYMLNYFEFIAVGVLEGELDERIVAKTLRGTLNTVYDLSVLYITELQSKNPRTLENYSTLRRHFRDL